MPMRSIGHVVLAGLILMAPTLLYGAGPTHSFLFNVTWSMQFADLLRAGVVYPRWLPDSFGGLGSSAFFFYGPLPFYVIGLVDLAGFGRLPPEWTIGIATTLLRIGAGLAMLAWLRPLAAPRVATIGAIVYMAAPYHLLDHYVRGSLGELAAFAVLPLIARAIRGLARQEARAVAAFALAYALLVLSHLPTALAASLLMIPPYLLFVAFGGGRSAAASSLILLHGVAGGCLGLALAAIYVLPALALTSHAAVGTMFSGHYAATNWLLAYPARWQSVGDLVFFGSLAAAYTIVAAAAVFHARRAEARGEIWLWGGMALVMIGLMAGVAEWPWMPWSPLSRLQFPWRLMVLIEFSVITCLAGCLRFLEPGHWPRIVSMALIPAIPAVAYLFMISVAMHMDGQGTVWRDLRNRSVALQVDAFEYLPNGHPVLLGAPSLAETVDRARDAMASYAGRPAAWSEQAEVTLLSPARDARGRMQLLVRAEGDARVVIRRFHFPIWRLLHADGSPGPDLEAFGDDLLLSFRTGPGTTRLLLTQAMPPVVVVATNVSSLSLVLLGILAIRRPRREAA